MAEHTESVSPESGSVKVETVVNKNLMEFYKSYPQCDVSVYYHTPMSEELKATLYPPLQEAIKGKSQQEANILIEFVQTGFEYQTDEISSVMKSLSFWMKTSFIRHAIVKTVLFCILLW